jgi:CRP-like cAMP-binding protein
MMEKLSRLISQNEVLNVLGERDRIDILKLAIPKTYERNEIIGHYGEVWEYLLLLESGVVNVMKISPEGRFLGALRLQDGDVFWSPSFIDKLPMPASLEVKEKSRVYLWQRDYLLPIIQKHPEALWRLCMVLMNRIRQASDFVEELTFQPVAGRLARLILTQFEQQAEDHISRDLTLDEMAAMIGTTSVMVCKLLSRFAGDGLIKVSRTEFELMDQTRLIEIATITS